MEETYYEMDLAPVKISTCSCFAHSIMITVITGTRMNMS